jgi:hypothetical protein
LIGRGHLYGVLPCLIYPSIASSRACLVVVARCPWLLPRDRGMAGAIPVTALASNRSVSIQNFEPRSLANTWKYIPMSSMSRHLSKLRLPSTWAIIPWHCDYLVSRLSGNCYRCAYRQTSDRVLSSPAHRDLTCGSRAICETLVVSSH